MFGSKRSSSARYSSLPNPNGSSPSMDRRHRRGPSAATGMKRYVLLAGIGILTIMVLLGGSKVSRAFLGSGGKGGQVEVLPEGYEEDWILEEEGLGYQPDGEYSSPPFIPEGALDEGVPSNPETPAGEEEIDEDVEDAMHIMPFPHKPSKPQYDDDDDEGVALDRPGDSGLDFTEIDQQEQDDYRPSSDSDDNQELTDLQGETTPEGPQSYEQDPDPTSTLYCSSPFNPDAPLIQYAIVIDAGSTGSRIHVYKFNNCGQTPQLEYETFQSLNPGLSSFAKDPTAAAASLDPLMQEAIRVVPEELRSCTPIEVKATAGLRLLPGREGQAILDEVRVRLETDWPFVVSKDESAIEVMDGKDEGVYAWITANYLLGKIGTPEFESSTLAVMDLGGASTQIVFEPTFPEDSPETLAEGDHKYALTFGGRDFTLYQHSYLGYGLMRARRSVHNLVAFTWSFLQPGGSSSVDWDDLDERVQIPNPCISNGMERRVELDPPGRKSVNVTMFGGESGFEGCNRVVELVMAKDAICEVKPCSFNGVYQPSLLDTFPSGQLLALSYFTDRIAPLLPAYSHTHAHSHSGEQTLEVSTLKAIAQDVCAGETAWRRIWGDDEYAMRELEGRPEYCLDLTFMHALLGLGYELGPERNLLVEKKLRGVELGWALGAGLALIDHSKLQCTA